MDGAADPIIFRPRTSEDLAFLLDSWGRSYYGGSHAHKSLSPEEFHAFHRPIRERFFSKPNTAVIVAASSTDPWHILGWIAVEQIPSGLVLQYLYVKSALKSERKGDGPHLATQLVKRAIPTSPVYFTHLTDRAARIMSKKQDQFTGWIHIPHLV